jgi:hypothetical protein
VRLKLIIPEHYHANGESQCESTILAQGVSRIVTSKLALLLYTSQPETFVTGQLCHETIFCR